MSPSRQYNNMEKYDNYFPFTHGENLNQASLVPGLNSDLKSYLSGGRGSCATVRNSKSEVGDLNKRLQDSSYISPINNPRVI